MTDPIVRLRPEIASIVPYRQGRTAAEDAFKLSSNENPYPPLPSVLTAMAEGEINRYPEGSAVRLRELLGKRYGVSPEQVQIGAGSVSLLSQFITAAAASGDEVVFSWRSFEAYPLLVGTAGATAVMVPNTADHRHDLPAMIAAITDRTRVVIVCSPNNPTSTIVTRTEFVAFMAEVPPTVLVILDEAYVEFVTDPDAVRGAPLLRDYPNLVLLRTFSKAYGLAGLRVGYAVGAEYLMDAARAVAIPLSVTDLAQRAAIASLEHEAELLERVAALNSVREQIRAGIVAQGWNVPEPQGNFIWLPTGDLTPVAEEIFARHGIVARALVDGLRVSVGETESVEKLLSASAEVVQMRRTAAPTATLD
ncbi:MAG: histidinol-phosphate transaminase [Salinibacterium sp.]|nr:histidinol-phosphate transaminase [Salinibacterium sp.]